jgi:hypothetical protein
MLLNRRSCPGVRGGALAGPRDKVKSRLTESQFPEGAIRTPAGKAPETGAAPCIRFHRCLTQPFRGAERCPVRVFKEMSGTPKSR